LAYAGNTQEGTSGALLATDLADTIHCSGLARQCRKTAGEAGVKTQDLLLAAPQHLSYDTTIKRVTG
jgi:hypothetical protein